MKNRWIQLTAVLIAMLLAFPSASFAKKGGGFAGSVTTVDASAKTITVSDKKAGAEKTFTVTDSTKITVAGTSATLADLTAGTKVTVTTGSSDTEADTITAAKAGKKGKKGKKGSSE